MKDVFRPTREPARTLYDAFQRESEGRDGHDFEDWHSAELNAVCNAARLYAQTHGLIVPTFEQVCDAEASASGHVDYGAKWAYRVAEVMQNNVDCAVGKRHYLIVDPSGGKSRT